MKSYSLNFYATREDLLPCLLEAEEHVALQYVPMDFKPDAQFNRYESVAAITRFGLPEYGDYNHDVCYLVMPASSAAVVGIFTRNTGRPWYRVDLACNPSGFALQPGGLFRGEAIIQGSVDTATGDPTSLSGARLVASLLKKRFTKKSLYYVGAEASAMAGRGVRLTPSVRSPPQFDLRV